MTTYKYRLVADRSIELREPATQLRTAEDVNLFLCEYVFDKETIDVQESFYAVYLDNSLKVKGFQLITLGGVNYVMVDQKVLFNGALLALASCLIVAHNHPSGSTISSVEDDKLTRVIAEGCKILNIRFVDHLIITSKGDYYSYKENGKL